MYKVHDLTEDRQASTGVADWDPKSSMPWMMHCNWVSASRMARLYGWRSVNV